MSVEGTDHDAIMAVPRGDPRGNGCDSSCDSSYSPGDEYDSDDIEAVLSKLFLRFWPTTLLDEIAKQTNKYGNEDWVRHPTEEDDNASIGSDGTGANCNGKYDGASDDESSDDDYSNCDSVSDSDSDCSDDSDESTAEGMPPLKQPKAWVHCSKKDDGARHRYQNKSYEWKNVTRGYILVWFGILLIHGVVKLRRITWLWGRNGCRNASVMNSMTYNAFIQLKHFLHFVDSEKLHPRGHARWNPLQKIQPILDTIIRTLQQCYSLGQTICIDESMIKYKGRFVSFVQYMIAKPIKHGIKVFVLCCSDTGYPYNFEVYLGKEYTEDGSATGVVDRLLRGANMAYHGEGRTLYTDNWYTNQMVMEHIYHEFRMSMLGTYTPTKKVSRTADDFPFAKVSNGALNRVERGWMRAAYQNVYIGNNNKPAYTMQATIWKDKKQVGLLHNFDVQSLDNGSHYVERWSPRRRRKREVESTLGFIAYTNNYNGVDIRDRDGADWGVSLKSARWYLRVFFWVFEGVIFAMFIIVKHMGADKSDPWHKYTKKDGRARFQMDLGYALIEAGIRMDCPNIEDLKDPEKRPAYMRRTKFVPCYCKECFFCKNGFTRGVKHQDPPGMPRFRTKEHLPPSPQIPPPPPNQHNKKRVNLGKGYSDYCRICHERLTEQQLKLNQNEQRKLIKQTDLGCLQCNGGKGVAICRWCWPRYKHNL